MCPVSPGPSGARPGGIPDAKPQCTLYLYQEEATLGGNLGQPEALQGLTHLCQGLGQSLGLEPGVKELEPGSSQAGSPEPLSLHQAVQTCRTLWRGAGLQPLSSSVAHSLPIIGHDERPCPQRGGHQDGPGPTLVLSPREL